MISPLFPTKRIWLTQFFLIRMWTVPLFWYSGICVYFSLRDFGGFLFSWCRMNWLQYLCTNKQWMGIKNRRPVYGQVNLFDDQVYEWFRFFIGKVYEWGRFWNTGSHTRTTITPPPPPPTHTHTPPPPPPQRAQTLRKLAYSNILKISSPKSENFQMKNSDSFRISAQNIDCGYSLEPPRWGGSNEYPQSMFLSRNKKNNVYPCKPQFYYIKVGFKVVKII